MQDWKMMEQIAGVDRKLSCRREAARRSMSLEILLSVSRSLVGIRNYTLRQRVFDCKYFSCKICFNVLNYVFSLFLIFTV